jgi:hypothetical protein
MTPSNDRPSVRIEQAAEKVESAAGSTWRSVRWLYPIMFFLAVGLAATFIIQQRTASSVDDLEGTVSDLDAQVAVMAGQVAELKSFVDEVSAPPSAEEQSRNEAISNAVRVVPEVKSILCEQFPQATACNVP